MFKSNFSNQKAFIPLKQNIPFFVVIKNQTSKLSPTQVIVLKVTFPNTAMSIAMVYCA